MSPTAAERGFELLVAARQHLWHRELEDSLVFCFENEPERKEDQLRRFSERETRRPLRTRIAERWEMILQQSDGWASTSLCLRLHRETYWMETWLEMIEKSHQLRDLCLQELTWCALPDSPIL